MVLVDYHTHPVGHGEFVFSADRLSAFITRARELGLSHLGFADHHEFADEIDYRILKDLRRLHPGIKLGRGLEFDYTPGGEREIGEILVGMDLDYSLGSVHHIGDWNFDHPACIHRYGEWEVEKLFAAYFDLLGRAAASGLFDVLGHLDLIRVFYPRLPVGLPHLRRLVRPVLDEVKRQGLVVEVNTNGLNKPVADIYPHRDILSECIRRGIPLTMASDAHTPERVGEGLFKLRELLLSLGCMEVATFEKRTVQMRSLREEGSGPRPNHDEGGCGNAAQSGQFTAGE